MVNTQVQQNYTIVQLKNSSAHTGFGTRVDDRAMTGLHQVPGRRLRIVVVAKVVHRHGVERVRAGTQIRRAVRRDLDCSSEHFGLTDSVAHRTDERRNAHVATKFDTFGGVEDRIVRVQLLGEPHAGLSSGQWKYRGRRADRRH